MAMSVAHGAHLQDTKGAKVLQAGVSLQDIEGTLRTLLLVLLVMIPATVVLASGGGLFLANRALAPIDAITRTAQRISAEDLSGRIGLLGPEDEVGRLARTFDSMLARLVGDLLFLARTDALPTASAAEPVDLGALLAAVVTQV